MSEVSPIRIVIVREGDGWAASSPDDDEFMVLAPTREALALQLHAALETQFGFGAYYQIIGPLKPH